MDFINYLCNIILINSVLYGIQAENATVDYVENLIKTAHLREAGYTDFNVAVIHLHHRNQETSERLFSNDLKRVKRSEEFSETPVHLDFTAFNISFDVSLRFNHMLANPDLPIVTRTANGKFAERGRIEDCYMMGMTESRGTVALSYCNGITGSIEEGEYLYRIDPLEPIQDGENEHVLVSKTRLVHQPGNIDIISQTRTDENQEDKNGQRRKRQTSTTFMIEVAVFVDANFLVLWYDYYGIDTRAERTNLMALKYNAAQAKLLLMEIDVGYTATIKIRSIEYWEVNTWFAFDPDSLNVNYNNFANDLLPENYLPVDHYTLFVGFTGSPQGLAGTPGMCTGNMFSVVSSTDFFSGYILAHEYGHALGMDHDDDTDCSGDTGMMSAAGNGANKWTTCSGASIEAFLVTPRAECLYRVDVDPADVEDWVNAININSTTAGAMMSDSDMCALEEGAGWESLYWDNYENKCTWVTCVNMNPGVSYSIMTEKMFRNRGAYCGDGKACYWDECLLWSDEKFRVYDYNNYVVQGGWTEWGPASGCSKTCGNGMTVRTRTCTNPEPQYAPPCTGSKYLAEICGSDPCPGDSTDAYDLRIARATEVCTAFVNNGVLSSADHTGAGDRYRNNGDQSCLVNCLPVDKGHGFMPNGADCVPTSSDWWPVIYDMPRKAPDLKSLCVNGRCQGFGCDGTNLGTGIDYCGVCGGNNNTCTVVDGVYDVTLATGATVDFVTLLAGTMKIQFYFDVSTMSGWFLEVYDTSGTGLVKQSIASNTVYWGNPVTAAGVDWEYVGNRQYLFTYGTITEDVVVKFYSDKGTANTGIHYGYSLPGAPSTTTTSTSTTSTTTTTPTTTTTTTPTTTTTTTPTTTTTTTPTTTTTTPTTTTTTPTTTTTTTPTTTTTTTPTTTTTTTPTTTTPTTTTTIVPPTTTTTTTNAPTTTTVEAQTTTTIEAQTTTTAVTYRCTNSIRCLNNHCVKYTDICDGEDDCGDNSDESLVCGAESIPHPTILLLLVLAVLVKKIM